MAEHHKISSNNKPHKYPQNITNVTVKDNITDLPISTKRYSNFNQIMKRSCQMFYIKKTLSQKFNQTKSELIYNKIIKRVRLFCLRNGF